MVQTVSFYRDVLLNAVETLKQLIKRNNELRMSIDSVFIKISRPLFRKLDTVFKDGLKTVQWDSKDLATYFAEVDKVYISIITLNLQLQLTFLFTNRHLLKSVTFLKLSMKLNDDELKRPYNIYRKLSSLLYPTNQCQQITFII